MIFAVKVGRRWSRSLGTWNAWIFSALLFLSLVGVASHFLPPIDEVPAGFPASLLWKFRVASWETQAVLWSLLGLLFGWFTERSEGMSRSQHQTSNSSKEMRYS
jgi:predicted cobalt transporter CbtA